MLKLKVKGNFKTTIKVLEDQKAALDGKTDFFEKLAQLINASIQLRVQRYGQGTDGQKLSPYTTKYSDWKKAKGRNTKFRDLTFSGNMFQSLSAEKDGPGARLFFRSASETNKARGNELRTPFFGISPRERDIIRREMKKLLEDK